MKKSEKTSTKITAIELQPVSDGKLKFLLKLVILLSVVVSIVLYIDKQEYFVGDQVNNHTERKWRSYYRFTNIEHKNADILVFGNSHASAGIEPYVVSAVTNTYCFILNTPGSSAIDAYFNLQEILANGTKPKVVILETSCLNSAEIGAEWGRIQSFEAKKNSWRKFLSMFHLFTPDEYVKAWSPTIRNHNFLLKDSSRIASNIENLNRSKNPDKSRFDLGRFSHGNTGLTDSTIAFYDKLGAPIKCAEHSISAENRIYLKKLYELCQEHQIAFMLFTAPMYYKTFDHYSIQKKKNLAVFNQMTTSLKWLDLQQAYDTSLYTVEAFNNEYSNSQHNTYYGMTLNSYLLSEYLLDNFGKILPDRQKDRKWINDFKNIPQYALLHEIPRNLSGHKSILKNKKIDSYLVRELVLQVSNGANRYILKLDKRAKSPNDLLALVNGTVQGVAINTTVQLSKMKEFYSPKYDVYIADLKKEAVINELVAISVLKKQDKKDK